MIKVMSERFLQPPEIVDLDDDEAVIFLAGPIQGAPPWQYDARKIIHAANKDIVVASPRRQDKKGEFIYEKQVDWETYYLNRAAKLGVVVFWLALQENETPGRPYAQTTRFELGEWKVKHQYLGANLVVGIEEGFTNERYIKRRMAQDCPGVPILKSLQETCEIAVEKLRPRTS